MERMNKSYRVVISALPTLSVRSYGTAALHLEHTGY